MDSGVLIPLFPLRILPLPGELVPLHIFEPRYKQLLQDVEERDVRFGIYFDHPINNERLGSYMRLESVIKRYPKGELDIIVKCEDVFELKEQKGTYPTKLYPGGKVNFKNIDLEKFPAQELFDAFTVFQFKRGISQKNSVFTVYQIANELNLDFPERYKFMTLSAEKQQHYLKTKVSYQTVLMEHEEKSRDIYHLN
jgi:hypothetical protein